ncbi:MAG TPA: helix-turn-helix transcriptional regulator [Thermoanaerobaculia bacterium]|nr:helix-turn-helix transcriptional regulator [Thermoanaerobaculia bacterium]
MRDELTELEQCVVGVVWRDGPMTAYEIAALFASSLSPYWSGSAGAIYPVVRRLRQRGLLRGTQKAWNGSRKTVLTITAKGVALLKAWLGPPLPLEAGAASYDSVRTRLFFIEVLAPKERMPFIAEAERVVREQLRLVQRRLEENEARGEWSEALGSLGVIYEMKARLRWLKAVRERIRKR